MISIALERDADRRINFVRETLKAYKMCRPTVFGY